jgi:hypothetical protein
MSEKMMHIFSICFHFSFACFIGPYLLQIIKVLIIQIHPSMQQFFLLIWVTLHVLALKGSSSGVSSYTLLITDLQHEIPIFLLIYTGRKMATLTFI